MRPPSGNVACDAEGGRRLIYYDFGMMDELTTEVRTGFVKLLFGINENDVKEVCGGLEEIGILRKGVDRVSIEKTVRFFLSEFNKGVSDGQCCNQLRKEERQKIQRKRRQRLGADLFSVGSDVPFKFPRPPRSCSAQSRHWAALARA